MAKGGHRMKESIFKEEMIGNEDFDSEKSHWIYKANGKGDFAINPSGTVTWKDGTWEDGTWEDGDWDSGTWKDGTWKNGDWVDGTWKKGTWRNGLWFDGTWEDGTWKNGTWEKGTWVDGTWKKGTWFNGIWEDGTWEDGTWFDGTWENGTWEIGWISDRDKKGNFEKDWRWWGQYVKSPINPKDYFDPNYRLRRNVNELGESKKKDNLIEKLIKAGLSNKEILKVLTERNQN